MCCCLTYTKFILKDIVVLILQVGMVDQADPQTSKFIGTDIVMDKEEEAKSTQESTISSSNKSQAVVEWLLGKYLT